MTKNEVAFLAAFLDELSDRFGNDGCNDMFLKDTPNNRKLVIAAEKHQAKEQGEEADTEVHLHNKKLGTMNSTVLDYLRDKFMKKFKLKKAEDRKSVV